MNFQFPARPAEWLHHPTCLAKAVINAVENLRDSHLEAKADATHLALDFRVALQENLPLTWANEYLLDGTTECLCPEPWPNEDDPAIAALVVRQYHVVPLTSTTIEGHEFPVPRA